MADRGRSQRIASQRRIKTHYTNKGTNKQNRSIVVRRNRRSSPPRCRHNNNSPQNRKSVRNADWQLCEVAFNQPAGRCSFQRASTDRAPLDDVGSSVTHSRRATHRSRQTNGLPDRTLRRKPHARTHTSSYLPEDGGLARVSMERMRSSCRTMAERSRDDDQGRYAAAAADDDHDIEAKCGVASRPICIQLPTTATDGDRRKLVNDSNCGTAALNPAQNH